MSTETLTDRFHDSVGFDEDFYYALVVASIFASYLYLQRQFGLHNIDCTLAR